MKTDSFFQLIEEPGVRPDWILWEEFGSDWHLELWFEHNVVDPALWMIEEVAA